jgi:hypothetical protein
MTTGEDSASTPLKVTLVDQNPWANRFKVPVHECDVIAKKTLAQYRDNWMKWISWYRHDPSEPHSIEAQIHRMLFNDITYRATVSVREPVAADVAISARSSTLAYLLDQGYLVSQVLSIEKLLDNGGGVISLKRLLKDVEKHRKIITREIYVAGDGLPYDYRSWGEAIDKTDPMVQMYGIGAPGLVRFAVSKELHETFDLLSGKQEHERNRNDVIRESIFKALNSWINCPSAREISTIRNTFIAHAGDAFRRGSYKFSGVKLSQIDEVQRAIVRVERALTDYVLSIRMGREVVPIRPLGIFSGLDLPYCSSVAQDSMHRLWDELSAQRNAWKQGVLQEATLKVVP